jgi:hypothetical protein
VSGTHEARDGGEVNDSIDRLRVTTVEFWVAIVLDSALNTCLNR